MSHEDFVRAAYRRVRRQSQSGPAVSCGVRLPHVSCHRNRRERQDRDRRRTPYRGATVTVVTRGGDESFSLNEAQENALLVAIAEIERGDYVTPEELLASLPKPR